MENYIGKVCPFCKAEITEADSVKVCPACGIPHHDACWNENNGCSTFGCSGQSQEDQNAVSAEACASCGNPMREGQAFCAKCGTPRVAAPKTFCGKCGNELQAGQEFCPKCGQKAGLTVSPEVSSAIEQFNANIQKKSKKSIKVPVIIGVIIAAVIAAVLIISSFSVDEIELSESSVELKVGDSVSVSYTISPDKAEDAKVTWKSSDESVATVSKNGKITGEGDGTCKITVTAGGKSDTLTVEVKSGPDFKEIYNQYCQPTWAEYGSDGSYLTIDTNPYDWDDDGIAYPAAYTAICEVNEALGLPESLLNDMGSTSGNDGRQTETFDDVTVSWRYHPDCGLEVTYKVN